MPRGLQKRHASSDSETELAPKRKPRIKPPIESVNKCNTIQHLFDTLRNVKDEKGRLLCEGFMRLPNRRSCMDYYDVIKNPLDLIKIQQKIKLDDYKSVYEFCKDVDLVLDNAKSYYSESSMEGKDASDLSEVFNEKKVKYSFNLELDKESENSNSEPGMELDTQSTNGNTVREKRGRRRKVSVDVKDEPEEMKADDVKMKADDLKMKADDIKMKADDLKMKADDLNSGDEEEYTDVPEETKNSNLIELLSSVLNLQDIGGRSMCDMFRKLPSKSLYPEYYKVINEPIDLKTICTKTRNKQYNNMDELENDMQLLLKNAKIFNEPGSQIYRDANSMLKALQQKRIDLDRGIKSVRVRSRKTDPNESLNLISSIAQESSSESEHLNGDDEYESDSELASVGESLLWNLFNTVFNCTSPNGSKLAEHFLRLPSIRFYPDYYEEISNPISLCKVKHKIKDGVYDSLDDLEEDLNTMFGNAKQYNVSGSKIYKDAEKLQKLLQSKKHELARYEVQVCESGSEISSDSKPPVNKGPGRPPKKSLSHKCDTHTPEDSPVVAMVKRRMNTLLRSILDYECSDGSRPCEMLMVMPSAKEYPEYYRVIPEPIDLKTIENKVRFNAYKNENILMSDIQLLFNNARHFNETSSKVYKISDLLENVVKEARTILGPLPNDTPSLTPKSRARSSKLASRLFKPRTGLQGHLQHLYQSVIEHTDNKGRQLSQAFFRLPSRAELASYYEVIKKPFDMQRIHTKLESKLYNHFDEMVADFILVLDNACKYNEPDSLIYKDSLALQKFLLMKKSEIQLTFDQGIPDVLRCVKDLLTQLFLNVISLEDDSGRCYGDSLLELPVEDGKQSLTFDAIRSSLDRCKYRRLDQLQADLFSVFERARSVSRLCSDTYEDACELQTYYLGIRDEICRHGDLLLSPALGFLPKHLQKQLEEERRLKDKGMMEPQEDDDSSVPGGEMTDVEENGYKHNNVQYNVGDFVYVQPTDAELASHIVSIEKFTKDSTGEISIYGCWFYRPEETFHLATRKFLEQEVFKSGRGSSAMCTVIGKCYVMFVKDYFKHAPEGFRKEDVYVCESRYFAKNKCFTKIKTWPPPSATILERPEPLSKTRVASVFTKGQVLGAAITDTLFQEVVKKDVMIDNYPDGEEGCQYFEQVSIQSVGTFKLGDCVYVRSERPKSFLARLDKMWKDAMGSVWFHGPWFIYPEETNHPLTRMFYSREVMQSSIEDTNPMLSVIGKCAILSYHEYIRVRPTEIYEKDIFICESKYNESDNSIRKFKLGGTIHFSLSDKVLPDEWYYFRKPIEPSKEPSPFLLKSAEKELDEVRNCPTPHTLSSEEGTPQQSVTPVPALTSTKPRIRKIVSGYILFASDVRNRVKSQNPDMTFGDISKMVGSEWKNLDAEMKADYEKKASELTKEAASQAKQNLMSSIQPGSNLQTVYECGWESCNAQFGAQPDLVAHIADENVHLNSAKVETDDYQCRWVGCIRFANKKARKFKPIQNARKLYRHLNDIHVKQSVKQVYIHQIQEPFRSQRGDLVGNAIHSGKVPPPQPMSTPQLINKTPSMYPGSMCSAEAPGQAAMAMQQSAFPQQQLNQQFRMGNSNQQMGCQQQQMMFQHQQKLQRPLDDEPSSVAMQQPVFVAPAGRTQRLLHSEAYIRYIENLTPNSRQISNWPKQLWATQQTIRPPVNPLPVNMLGQDKQDNVLDALWSLRDHMLKDSLSISRVLDACEW